VQGVVVVYIWLPPLVLSSGLSRLVSDDVGHAALQLGDRYISFYPCPGEKLWNPFAPIASFLLPDVTAESKSPTLARQVVLEGLDEAAMLDGWLEISGLPYHVLRTNCCTVVGRLLLRGFQPRTWPERLALSISTLSSLTFWEPINLYRFALNLADALALRRLQQDGAVPWEHSLLLPLLLRRTLRGFLASPW
jgi:hypothetical protein